MGYVQKITGRSACCYSDHDGNFIFRTVYSLRRMIRQLYRKRSLGQRAVKLRKAKKQKNRKRFWQKRPDQTVQKQNWTKYKRLKSYRQRQKMKQIWQKQRRLSKLKRRKQKSRQRSYRRQRKRMPGLPQNWWSEEQTVSDQCLHRNFLVLHRAGWK